MTKKPPKPFGFNPEDITGIVFISGKNPYLILVHRDFSTTTLMLVKMANGDIWFTTSHYPIEYDISQPNVFSAGVQPKQKPPKKELF